MYLCYVDESGTSSIPGNTSHFVLAALAIPVECWKECDEQISKIKDKWELSGIEIHTAWMLRKYLEQKRIPNFVHLDYNQRRISVNSFRKSELLRLQRSNPKLYKQVKKNYRLTEKYIHLSLTERKKVVTEMATLISD